MGFFDFLRRRREEKERKKRESDQVPEVHVSKRKKTRKKEKTSRYELRLISKEKRKKQAYNRIQFWIEERIGPMCELTDDEIHARLDVLLTQERGKKWKISSRGKEYDPYAGLQAYITTNSYRKMLDSETEGDELDQKTLKKIKKLDRHRTGYSRLQLWLESRIGDMDTMEPEVLHEKLLDLLEEEKERLIRENRDPGKCKGLELYIKNGLYKSFLK